MTHVGQCVELRTKNDVQIARTERGSKRRGESGDSSFQREARLLQQGRDGFGALVLFVAEFGVRMHEMTELDEFTTSSLNRVARQFVFVHSMTATTSPALTESPAFTLMLLTTPLFSALTTFSIFMASRIMTVSPASTC